MYTYPSFFSFTSNEIDNETGCEQKEHQIAQQARQEVLLFALHLVVKSHPRRYVDFASCIINVASHERKWRHLRIQRLLLERQFLNALPKLRILYTTQSEELIGATSPQKDGDVSHLDQDGTN